MNKAATTALLLIMSATLHAESLEEKKFWKGQMDYVNEKLESAAKDCDVKFSFDWIGKEKLRDESAKHNASPNGVCTNIVDEVDSICRSDADSKAAVKAKIKGFTCGYSDARSLDMKGGIVQYLGNNEQANFSDWAKPWLEKHL